MKPKFSIVVIARNEEQTLPRLLASLNEFIIRGGEVIVLDTGSQDQTANVAKSFGCKVFEVGKRFVVNLTQSEVNALNRKFVVGDDQPVISDKDSRSLFDYASARNYAASLAENNMISMPDCDEIFTSLDIDYVNNLINEGFEQLEFNFVFSHDEFGNEVIKFIQCKFYDRTKLEWKGIIHEVLSGEAKRTLMEESKFKIEHYQNERTDRRHYLRGLAIDCYKNPDNDRNSHYFARELLYTGRYKSAIKEFERHISMNRWVQERAQSMIFVGDCYGHLNRPELQVMWYNKAFYTDNTRREALLKLARFYQHNKNPQSAVCYATAALEIPYHGYYGNQATHYTYEPHEILYWGYGWMGNIAKAREHFMEAYRYAPQKEDYARDAQYYFPKISFVIPHLLREEGLVKCLTSINNLNYPKFLIETIIIEGQESVPEKVSEGLAASSGEWVCYAANDIEFHPDSVLAAIELTDRYGLIAFNTGELLPDEGNICEHFIIKKDLVEAIGGEIFSTKMNHVGVDNLLWAKCSKLGQAVRCKEAIVYHHHFSKGADWDEVYEKGWASKDIDRQILTQELSTI